MKRSLNSKYLKLSRWTYNHCLHSLTACKFLFFFLARKVHRSLVYGNLASNRRALRTVRGQNILHCNQRCMTIHRRRRVLQARQSRNGGVILLPLDGLDPRRGKGVHG